MDIKTGRFDHIEDVLAQLHGGQWFGWSDSKNKIYANLVLTEKMGVGGELVDNPHSLPTEKSLTDALAEKQSDFDAQEYARNRAEEYPSTGDQLDYIFHNGVAKWKTDMIEPVKAKYPKTNVWPGYGNPADL
jgi:hypothetical protein